jgi:hypothetical protein
LSSISPCGVRYSQESPPSSSIGRALGGVGSLTVLSHDEVGAYHAEIVARLLHALPQQLVGIYAGGSFALGGFTPGRSDLDVAAVCRGHLADERKRAFVARLRHESLPCPARGLEFVLYPEETTRQPSADAGFQIDLNSGARMPFHLAFDPSTVPRCWYVIDRSIYAAHGVTLYGLPAAQIFAPIPKTMLLPALVEAIHWHETRDVARDDDAVLNACRSWRYAVESIWSSKQAAGEWALTNVEDGELVAAALSARLNDERLPRPRVERFLRRIADKLAAAQGSVG